MFTKKVFRIENKSTTFYKGKIKHLQLYTNNMFLGNILKMINNKSESKTRFVNRNIYIYGCTYF